MEPVEERTPVQLDRPAWIFTDDGVVELRHIAAHDRRVESKQLALARYRAVAEGLAQVVHGVGEAVTGGRIRLIGPQESDQLVPGQAAAPSRSEQRQQGQGPSPRRAPGHTAGAALEHWAS